MVPCAIWTLHDWHLGSTPLMNCGYFASAISTPCRSDRTTCISVASLIATQPAVGPRSVAYRKALPLPETLALLTPITIARTYCGICRFSVSRGALPVRRARRQLGYAPVNFDRRTWRAVPCVPGGVEPITKAHHHRLNASRSTRYGKDRLRPSPPRADGYHASGEVCLSSLTTSRTTVARYCGRAVRAGPRTTDPSAMSNLLPWHAQLIVPSATSRTEQP